MIYWKPFKSKFSLYSSVFSELTFSGVTVSMFGFLQLRSDYVNSVVGWIMVSGTMSSMLGSWGCVGIQQWKLYQLKKKLEAAKKLKEETKSKITLQLDGKDNKISDPNLDELNKESENEINNQKELENTVVQLDDKNIFERKKFKKEIVNPK